MGDQWRGVGRDHVARACVVTRPTERARPAGPRGTRTEGSRRARKHEGDRLSEEDSARIEARDARWGGVGERGGAYSRAAVHVLVGHTHTRTKESESDRGRNGRASAVTIKEKFFGEHVRRAVQWSW